MWDGLAYEWQDCEIPDVSAEFGSDAYGGLQLMAAVAKEQRDRARGVAPEPRSTLDYWERNLSGAR